jgi:hypothetical protein
MGGSYRQCSECGKRALSIATRCPGCGRELAAPAHAEVGRRVELGRYVSPGLAGLVAVAVIVAAVELGGAADPSDGQAPTSAGALADSSEVAYALGATARLDTESVEATTPESRPPELLVACTWTNVRKARSRRADLEAVLTPGDSVVADSLERDWYRVRFMGEVLGYAHRSTLASPGTLAE